jgi:hypothetical protein
MDAATFFENRPPSLNKRSRISPFGSDLLEYKKRGYTLLELQEFLAANGVKISLAGISAYIRRMQLRSEGEAKQLGGGAGKPKSTSAIPKSGTNLNRPAGFGSFQIKPDTKDL